MRTPRPVSDVTLILSRLDNGDAAAAHELLPLVYDSLRKLAAKRIAQEKPGQTIQATALVHEAYLRLVGPETEPRQWSSRRHFFAASAEAMRRILVDNARRKQRIKHGGEQERVDFDVDLIAVSVVREDLSSLDAALSRLAEVDPLAAELIQLRYFAGLTQAETADAMGLPLRSADRLWAFARAWLHRELHDDQPPADSAPGGRVPPEETVVPPGDPESARRDDGPAE